MKSKRSWLVILLWIIAVLILFTGCSFLVAMLILESKVDWQGPSSGIWYCEDLHMQLCFQHDSSQDNVSIYELDSKSYALVEGDYVMCDVWMHDGTYRLCVIHQDLSKKSGLDDRLFEGEFVSLSEENYIVSGSNGRNYIFKRIPEFSLNTILAKYENKTHQYSGTQNIGSVKHIEIATQKAKELWQKELGITFKDGDSITVEIDIEKDCWLVSTSSLASLIKRNGDVIDVWKMEDGPLIT